MSTPVETVPAAEPVDLSNPFLQFVDPKRYRELVELAHQRTATGRLISPLSRPTAGHAAAPAPGHTRTDEDDDEL